MSRVAIGLFCKTPAAGRSKTRLSPPLAPEECSEISTCFIRDLAASVAAVAEATEAAPVAIYTPAGTEHQLRSLLPPSFSLLLQDEGELGQRLTVAVRQLLDAGHRGVILLNSDSPTLPLSVLRDAVRALQRDACVVLAPATDGGYTLIGVTEPHRALFTDMPWSTPAVFELSLARARTLGLPVVTLPLWYDVDDAATLDLLERELAGTSPPFAAPGLVGADAPATRAFMARRGAKSGAGGPD
jgi:hypothetical protein